MILDGIPLQIPCVSKHFCVCDRKVIFLARYHAMDNFFSLCATSRCATTRTRSQQQKSRFRNLGKVNYAQRFRVARDSARSPERTFVLNREKMLKGDHFTKNEENSTFSSQYKLLGAGGGNGYRGNGKWMVLGCNLRRNQLFGRML